MPSAAGRSQRVGCRRNITAEATPGTAGGAGSRLPAYGGPIAESSGRRAPPSGLCHGRFVEALPYLLLQRVEDDIYRLLEDLKENKSDAAHAEASGLAREFEDIRAYVKENGGQLTDEEKE